MGMMLHRNLEENNPTPPPPPPQMPSYAVDMLNRKRAKGRWKRAVVYVGTRNVYSEMETAAKSMLYHNPNLNVYFLIEDDTFPMRIPDSITCVNVSNQPWILRNSPNYNNPWTHMVLLRVALTKLFPEYDRILSIDCDTIVVKDISELWTMDMGDNYIAVACERFIEHRNPNYFNVGVMVQNLKLLRETRMDDRLIDAINSTKYRYPEQDAMIQFFEDKFIELPCEYNDNFACGESADPSIVHYIGKSKRDHKRLNLKGYYACMSWDDIAKRRTYK